MRLIPTLLAVLTLAAGSAAYAAGVADLHAKHGIACESCHGPDKKGEVTTATCTSCHMGHAESENFYNQCHQFDYKVP